MSWSIFSSDPIIEGGVIVSDTFPPHTEIFSWFVKEYYPIVCDNQYKVLVKIWKNGSGEVVYTEVLG